MFDHPRTTYPPAMRIWWLAGVLITVVTAVVVGLGISGLIDLQVYRAGGWSWIHGVELYGPGFPSPVPGPHVPDIDSPLPFTYPPVAAVVFAPLAWASWPVSIVVITLAGLLALSGSTLLIARELGRPAACGLLAATLGLLTGPVRETLMLGQVNLLLMALVLVDCLLPVRRWPRGLLVGLAAAIKLTPAVFVLYFLARKDWRAALTSVGSFLVATLVGWLAAPEDSLRYWTATLFDSTRIGRPEYSANQSLRGALHRLGLPDLVETSLWIGLIAAVLVAAWIAMRKVDRLTALLVAAAVALLCSPVSWSHHWVWVLPALMIGWYRGGNRWALGLVTAVFLIGPQWMLPTFYGREFAWSWWQHLLGDSFVLVGLGFIAWAATRPRSTPDSPRIVLDLGPAVRRLSGSGVASVGREGPGHSDALVHPPVRVGESPSTAGSDRNPAASGT
ncbi:glycosyltransferase 87 family protein [Kutzneria viridogrisea]